MFAQMVGQMATKDYAPKKMVSLSDWELFCKEFIFAKLKGETLGRAFCKRFGISSWLISNMMNEEDVKLHIRKFYVK
jgi:hypothetical protein